MRSRTLQVIAIALLTHAGAFSALAYFSNNGGPEAFSPSLKILERPASSYTINEVIHYRIQISWPDSYPVRMQSPDLNLINLEFIGISQETISGPEGDSGEGHSKQILNFKFRALKPGPARIQPISLKWLQANGAIRTQLNVPGLDLIIKPKSPVWLFSLAGGAFVAVTLAILFTLTRQKTKTLPPKQPPSLSLHDTLLNELRTAHTNWETHSDDQEFINKLAQISGQFTAQELDWFPSRDSYNDLRKRAEAKWSKKDASTLYDFFKTIEYERFSGAKFDRRQLKTAYETLYSLIDQKRIIST